MVFSMQLVSDNFFLKENLFDKLILNYLTGGYDGASRQCLASVERYDLSTNTWRIVSEMSARRSGAGVGVLDNLLYAVGGKLFLYNFSIPSNNNL